MTAGWWDFLSEAVCGVDYRLDQSEWRANHVTKVRSWLVFKCHYIRSFDGSFVLTNLAKNESVEIYFWKTCAPVPPQSSCLDAWSQAAQTVQRRHRRPAPIWSVRTRGKFGRLQICMGSSLLPFLITPTRTYIQTGRQLESVEYHFGAVHSLAAAHARLLAKEDIESYQHAGWR